MGSALFLKKTADKDLHKIQKLTYAVNTVILLLVFGLAGFFWMCRATFLVWFSIPTAMVYLIGYWLIRTNRLTFYIRLVYSWLTFYMGVTTVCLGYGYGFHLYSFSVIPTIFVAEYLGYRLQNEPVRSVRASLVIAAFSMLCTGYVALFGPLLETDQKYAAVFWISNSCTVFGFLIYYCKYFVRTIIRSEQSLIEIAHMDRLTQLHNRHYMLDRLDALTGQEDGFIAMADIDDFKKINDTYGHNAGDLVLKTVSERMRTVCEGCEIARWGGEEFLLLSFRPLAEGKEMLEQMRRQIAQEPIVFEEQPIRVTLTIGIGSRQTGQSIDAWIQTVDEKLYYGKNNGKNQIVE